MSRNPAIWTWSEIDGSAVKKAQEYWRTGVMALISLIPGGGAIGYKNGIGCKMFPLIHYPVICLSACGGLGVHIFHFHGGDAFDSVDDPAIAYKKDLHRRLFGVIIGDFESDDRHTGGGEGLAHHCPFRPVSRGMEIIQLGPEMTVAKGAIHAPFAEGVEYGFFGETPNKKGCWQGPQGEAVAAVFMKVGRCNSPYGPFPLAVAVGP